MKRLLTVAALSAYCLLAGPSAWARGGGHGGGGCHGGGGHSGAPPNLSVYLPRSATPPPKHTSRNWRFGSR